MRASFLIVLILILISPFSSARSSEIYTENRSTSEILAELDRLINDRQRYVRERQNDADSVRAAMEATETVKEKIRMSLELADIQRHISADSSIATLNYSFDLSRAVKDSVSAEKIVILRAREYFNLGQIHEAFLDLDYALLHGIHPHNWLIFHDVSRHIYMTLGLFNEYQPFDGDMIGNGINHAMNEKKLLSADNPLYHLCNVFIALGKDDLPAMKTALDSTFIFVNENPELLNVANSLMGQYYLMTDKEDLSIRHFALAAISDIKSSNLDEVALLKLGEILMEKGDYSRAHSYLSVALEIALQSHTRLNLMRVSDAFVDSGERIEKDRHTKLIILTVSVIVLQLLCIVIVWLVIEKRNEVRRLRSTERLLASSNLAKDTYIGEFLNLCSGYIESLEEYNKMCRRKITAGQTAELLELIKSDNVLEEQRAKFFDVFDRAFLHLFPDFVKDVNSLLLPERQIITTPDTLTTELRILALSLLGIDDSTKVASFLGLTTNTIYNYRNKMRSRARDRNTFDRDIRTIRGV